MSDRLFLLDTNIVLALVRGNALARHIDTTFGLRAAKIRPMISVVTHGEVRVLASRNGWGKKKLGVLQNALDNLVTVDVSDPDVLDAYVEIDLYSQAHPDGARNMGKNDLWPLVQRPLAPPCSRPIGTSLISIRTRWTSRSSTPWCPRTRSTKILNIDRPLRDGTSVPRDATVSVEQQASKS